VAGRFDQVQVLALADVRAIAVALGLIEDPPQAYTTDGLVVIVADPEAGALVPLPDSIRETVPLGHSSRTRSPVGGCGGKRSLRRPCGRRTTVFATGADKVMAATRRARPRLAMYVHDDRPPFRSSSSKPRPS
jgi:hypothetical protein